MLRFVLCLCLLFAPLRALAGDVALTFRTPQGAPIVDAVVTIDAPHADPVRFDWPYRVAQQNLQFDPFVLIVPVGADVAFPNLDKVRHHVYSFSPAKTFELKLYSQDQTRVVNFDKPGIVPLGCNIHDNMVGFVVVVDTPWAAKTDASGQAVLHGVPAGPQSLHVWHPYLTAPDNMFVVSINVPKDGVAHEQLNGQLRAPLERRRMY
jgi:plastocyanin